MGDPDLEAGGEVLGERGEGGRMQVGEKDKEGLVGVVGPGAGGEAYFAC